LASIAFPFFILVIFNVDNPASGIRHSRGFNGIAYSSKKYWPFVQGNRKQSAYFKKS
jgi:hypothetical protein